MTTGRSPLKQPPLRNPGESLQRMRDDLLYDKLLPYWLITLFLIMWSVFAWLDHLGIVPMSPLVLTLFSGASFVVSFVKYFRIRKQVRAHNRGLEAEVAVGQFLEQFRKDDYKVFHDIPGESGGKKFNLDHVLVGPKGIFTVETKSRSKPEKGECKILYDGRQVSINGAAPFSEPVDQAKAQAAWLEDLLKSCTALKSVPITPLVVFPGWYVDYSKAGNAKVKVTTEKLIWSCIQSTPFMLGPHDAALVENRLTEHIQKHK
jgi:hypothetical protein